MRLARAIAATAAAAFVAAPAAHADLAVDHVAAGLAQTAGNGNGVVEPGESFALTESVLSAEFDTLTGVSGTLATSEPGVTVDPATAAWPDLNFGAVAASTTPFGVALASSLECGVAIPFEVTLHTSAGDTPVPFTLPTGAAGAYVARDSADVPRAIPDGNFVTTSLTVADAGRVKGMRVRIGHIAHSYVGDLVLTIVSPDGRTVVLSRNRGGSGADYLNTVFDDAAATSIRTASAPFSGSFRPEQPLSAMDGAPLNGTWTLRVSDTAFGNTGFVESWGTDVAPAVCDGSAPPPTPPPPPDPARTPPGFDKRSDKAQGQWPDPPGFDRNSPKAHAS